MFLFTLIAEHRMRFLRWILVILLSLLIVWWLWSLSKNQEVSTSKVFSPIWNRLTSDWTQLAQNQPLDNTISVPNDTTVWNTTIRVKQELLPELVYGSLSRQQYSTLLTNWSVLWNQDADYIMLQYCDYSMKYCRQSQREGTLIAYQDALNTNLWYILKPFLLESNTMSQTQHHALQCAQKTWNESQINRMHALLFNLDSRDEIRKSWEQLDIPWFQSCLINTSSLESLISQRNLARNTFEITQLPSFVMIDTRTLDWTLIPGLYEEELVTSYLKQL